MNIDYLRPMTVGNTYVCRGEALRVGGRLAVGDTHIYDDAGVLVVRATTTVVVRR
jgi:acyl-coenzyme A thioesterase PaaI-like protein